MSIIATLKTTRWRVVIFQGREFYTMTKKVRPGFPKQIDRLILPIIPGKFLMYLMVEFLSCNLKQANDKRKNIGDWRFWPDWS